MEQEVLDQFTDLLGRYGQHKAFIDKATEQMGNFKADVIQKVIADHQIKASMLDDEIGALVAKLQEAVAELNAGISEAEQSKGDLGERIEELELRRLIGEISEEDFEAQSADGRGTVDSANSTIEDLAGQRGVIEAALNQWSELSGAKVEIPEPVVEEPVAEEAEASSDDEVSVEEEAPEEAADDDSGDEVEEVAAAEDDPSDASEESVEVEAASDVEFDFDEDAGDIDVAASEEAESVEVEFDDDNADIGVEFTGDSGEDAAPPGEGDPRRALLLYQEGTPEEQIYPFSGEVLTVGRGRDNDIQIKNDSKVSRFHCKLFRRGDNFYVEDNKSSNGTLINGELITERRLFGGEEIIIGETFFRFRIM